MDGDDVGVSRSERRGPADVVGCCWALRSARDAMPRLPDAEGRTRTIDHRGLPIRAPPTRATPRPQLTRSTSLLCTQFCHTRLTWAPTASGPTAARQTDASETLQAAGGTRSRRQMQMQMQMQMHMQTQHAPVRWAVPSVWPCSWRPASNIVVPARSRRP
jgi:hypothetical protein